MSNEMKACFQFCAKSHRGVSGGCYIGSPKGCRRGTRQSEQSSDNICCLILIVSALKKADKIVKKLLTNGKSCVKINKL